MSGTMENHDDWDDRDVAQYLGERAALRGLDPCPELDPSFMSLARSVGKKIGDRIPLMDAWERGYKLIISEDDYMFERTW